MKNVGFNGRISDIAEAIPSGWCSFALCKGEEPLYRGYTVNLSKRLQLIIAKAETDKLYAELISEADLLQYRSRPDAISALVDHKVGVLHEAPAFQQRVHTWDGYVYLGIDPLRFPFMTFATHTNDDWFYLGPFRSRFFLADVIDSISRILRLPFCETGTYPCEKLDRGTCRGYCLALDEHKASDPEATLEKLEPLLKEAYIHPNNGILEMVQKERERYFDELEFEKADLLDDEIELLRQYRDWLNFLFVAKDLSFETGDLKVEKGRITRCRLDGKDHAFPTDTIAYRPNEALALNLDQVDEARVLYDHYTNNIKRNPNA